MNSFSNQKKKLSSWLATKDKVVKPLVLSNQDQITEQPLLPTSPFPLLIRPKVPGLRLTSWVRDFQPLVEEKLWEHRALLFRDFVFDPDRDFSDFVTHTSKGERLSYRDRTTPRKELGNHIYTSTVYPADQTIAQHNEGSYWTQWPLKLYFCCNLAPEEGGETPLTDTRAVFEAIPEGIRKEFTSRGWRLCRNYNDGIGLPWQEVFQTENQREVEAYCDQHHIHWEWQGKNHLRTWQIRQPTAIHPKTGHEVWFNHVAFFHISSYDAEIRQGLLASYSEENLPYNTYFGDGGVIDTAVVAEIREAYDKATLAFPWQTRDVLLIDNMGISHGRRPYKGARLVTVAMTDPHPASAEGGGNA